MPAALQLSFLETDFQDLAALHEADVVPHLGSATVRLPLTVSVGRADFGPRLGLEYDSTAGNSAFGLGWSLTGLLTISRSTRRGFPKYDHTDGYVFSGSGELVPALEKHGSGWQPRVDDRGTFWVRHYRARVETTRVRVEQWIEKATGRDHWRTRDVRNVVTVYGFEESRIADPTDPSHTFTWLPEAQFDPLGNAIVFEYAQENLDDVDVSRASERCQVERPSGGPLPQRYVKRVLYGNTRGLQPDQPVPPDNAWRFEMVFDYGDHADPLAPIPVPDQPWPVRLDAHSTFAPGFEVRTYRLCRRILCFHRFDALGANPVLTSRYVLGVVESAAGSVLASVTHVGSRRDAGTGQLDTRSLPPVRFTYAQPSVAQAFRRASAEAEVNVPGGLGVDHRWVDLFGEGLPGILAETHQAWYYKANEGEGRFGPQQVVLERPAYRLGQCALTDFDGDGNTNLVVLHGRLAGFYEYERDAGAWTSFEPIAALPHAEGAGPKAQWADLNGDGRADLLVADPQRLTWYPSEGKRGFGAPVEIQRPTEAPVAAPCGESLALDFFFADMNGDGLVDQVRVRNGRVEYWPHAGNGRFGDPILMDGSPVFAPDHEFDPRRVFLVDLDGNGTADILYVGPGEARYWINASGNELVEGGRLTSLPYIDDVSTLRVVDFLGDGTPCLVWSSPLTDRGGAIQYLPLTGVTPRLLLSVDNSMGREVQFEYGTSARHYLRDRDSGTPWRTRLPRHRVVVDVERVIDHVAGSHTVMRYVYHDGCFDGDERIFRGFGFVEQFDTESHDGAVSAPEIAYTAPACVRTWYHVGREFFDAPPGRFSGDPLQTLLAPQIVEDAPDLLPGEAEDAVRALAGTMIRQEVFGTGADGTLASNPFQVSQSSYRVRRIQPSAESTDVRHPASFMYYRAERLDDNYEQTIDDPRTTHILTLDVDAYGIVRQECRVAYPRRAGHPVETQAQHRMLVGVNTSHVLNIDQPERYELGVPIEQKDFEVAGIPPGLGGVVTWDGVRTALPSILASPRRFDEALTGTTPEARLIGDERIYYWNETRTAPMPLGGVGTLTLLHHTESACFTPELIAAAYGGRVDSTLLLTDGMYNEQDGLWWQRGTTLHYHDGSAFFQLVRQERPDGATTLVKYDADALAVVEVEDALGNRVQGRIDYHVMAPDRITDPNGGVTEVLYDPLGVAIVSTVQGQILASSGAAQPYGQDLLASYTPQPGATFDAVVANPSPFLQNGAQFVLYDLDAWAQSATPPRAVRLVREELRHDGTGGGATESPVQITVSYFDGLQRVLQAKTKVEPGPAVQRDTQGQLMLDVAGHPVQGETAERWLVSGHTIYNRKQQPVRQYEPFHTTRVAYEPETALAQFGVFRQFRYDATGRLIREEIPNGTETRAQYQAWRVARYDPNDTVMDSLYRVMREMLPDGSLEKAALQKAKAHADTPTVIHLDPLGRDVRRVEMSGEGADRVTETRVDLRGNPVSATDARGITAFSYVTDMLGRPCTTVSADGGEAWRLVDIYDREIHVWNSRGVHERRTFDALDRQTSVAVDGALGLQQITERVVYGEDPSVTDAALRSLRGRPAIIFDQAGIVRIAQCDPSGQVLRAERQFRHDYKSEPNWTDPAAVVLDPERYATVNILDALGRLRSQSLPDGTMRRLEYLPSGGLARSILASDDGKVSELAVLNGAKFNARGQRTSARLGNGVEMEREFDNETFRTSRIVARRPSGGPGPAVALQDLRYVYDPVGNITHAADETQQPAVSGPFLQGLNVSPETDYTYDAFYRLQRATGRVHQALLEHDYRPDVGQPGALKGTRHLTFNNGAAVERYTRTYSYDPAGNLTKLVHTGVTQNWTTDFWVSSASNRSVPALDPSGTPASAPESRFDAAGNLSFVPHLRRLEWTYRSTLARAVIIDRSALGEPDDAEYYQYDGGGLRVRKVTERLVSGAIEATETLNLDGCTITRVRAAGNLILERFTSHVSDSMNRIALIDRWSRDDLARETDSVDLARVRYQLTNHLGSAQLELDEHGAVVSYEEYFPFGVTAFIAGDNVREVARRAYRFCDKERDDSTGLYYVEQRYYAPWMVRWMSPDPVGPEDDLNLYAYVLNNPINLTDPDGLGGEMPEAKISYVPTGLKGAWAEAYKKLTPAQKKEYEAGRLGFLVDSGGIRPASRAEILAEAERRRKEGEFVNIGLTGDPYKDTPPETRVAISGDGGEIVFDNEAGLHVTIADDPTPGILAPDDAPGRSPIVAPPAATPTSTPSDTPGGAEHGADGRDGGPTGPGANAADGKGTSSSRGSDAASAHPANGGSSPTPGGGGTGGGVGPGYGRRGLGPGAGGTSLSTAPGSGAGGARGSGHGETKGNRTGRGTNGDRDGRKGGKVGGGGGTGGGTRVEGPPGGTGKEPGGTGTDPTGVLGGTGTGPGIGDPGGTLPLSPDGLPPLTPGQTQNGDDPFGSGIGNPTGLPGASGMGGGGNVAGTSTGSGHGQGTAKGTDSASTTAGGTGGKQPTEPPSVGDHIVHYLGYLNLEFGDGDPEGAATGGIPGAFGSHNWGGWGQAIYGVLTVASVVLMFFGGGAAKAATAGEKLAVSGGSKAARGLIGRALGGAFDALRNKWAKKIPWVFGNTGAKAIMGATDAFGNIVIKKGLSGKRVFETVLHEGVHRFFSPRGGGWLNAIRARIGMWGYQRSHLLKYVEEALAETVGKGSLRAGLAHPLNPAYKISGVRAIGEFLAYLGIAGGASYGTYKAAEAVGGSP